MSKIISFQVKNDDQATKLLSQYKYAIPEHTPIELSNGLWLHTYKVTRYDDFGHPAGDQDSEQDAVDREMYG